MRKTVLILLALTMGVMVFTSVAQAQYGYNEVKMNNWEAHAGVGWFSGDTKNSTTWIAGVGYEYPTDKSLMGMNAITLSVDYYPVETLADETASVVPMLIGYRKYVPMGNNKWYFGAGLGGRWVSRDIPELKMDKGLIFGWDLNAGIYFNPTFFGQTRYIAGSHPGDDGLFTLELGYKF